MVLALRIRLSEVLEPDLRLVCLAGNLCKVTLLILIGESLDQHAAPLFAILFAFLHVLAFGGVRRDNQLFSWSNFSNFVRSGLIESVRTNLTKRVLAALRKATSKGSGTGVLEG